MIFTKILKTSNQIICGIYSKTVTNVGKNVYISDRFKMGDEEDRKLFVGGLPQEASQDDLQVKI